MRLPSEDDDEGYPVRIHEQLILMPQDSVRSEKGYPLHLARRIRTTRPQHHQQIQGKVQGEDQRGLHATGAGACGTRLHNVGRGVI